MHFIITTCKHLNGDNSHCVKIGGKCVEKRWFGKHSCSMRKPRKLRPPPMPPGPE